jgi:predicted acylesterase/phospholipase RssA
MAPIADDHDAICFTAGATGLVFAAGTIHAHLAADRTPPAVVAGISAGSISAAALQRCYQELEQARAAGTDGAVLEAARWEWFRRYLTALWDEPLRVIWDGLPDQTDFFADRPPIGDATIHGEPNDAVGNDLAARQPAALRERYLLVKLGQWLAGVPVSVGAVAKLVVAYVRWKERYESPRLWRLLGLPWRFLYVLTRLLVHVARHPTFFPERRFPDTAAPRPPSWRWMRPLFGWRVWLASVGFVGVLFGVGGFVVRFVSRPLWTAAVAVAPWLLGGLDVPGVSTEALLALIVASFALLLIMLGALLVSAVKPTLLAGFGLQEGPVNDFHLRRRLARVFRTTLLAGFGLLEGLVNDFHLRLRLARVFRTTLLAGFGLQEGLVNDFHLRLRLARVFRTTAPTEPTLSDVPMPVVIVATPLETGPPNDIPMKFPSYQLWFKRGASLLTALRTAVGLPGLMGPVRLTPAEQHTSLSEVVDDRHDVHLVDGSVVRQNPLPALFSFLKDQANITVVRQLEAASRGNRAAIHVVYGVPIAPAASDREPLAEEAANVVDVGFASIRLAQRRDTQLEVAQTNLISRVQQAIGRDAPAPDGRPTLTLFADEIAPTADVGFKNPLRPTRDEILSTTAAGCRRTLETLYADRLRTAAAGRGTVLCPAFLTGIDTRRPLPGREPMHPGLSEVCRACTRELTPPQRPLRTTASTVALLPDGPLFRTPPATLAGDRPRIVFVANGGVFRGAFHIGVIGALLATKTEPDLIVGASVGTLMGGALAAMTCAGEPRRWELLGDLVRIFEHVDQEVALTRRLKTAVRDVGVRAREVRLSPRQVRRMLKRGSRHDPGYAAAGAPPPLIDAISELCLIPHRQTATIAAEFVAGHVTQAIHAFLGELRHETLVRLDIDRELIGAWGLVQAARRIFGHVKPGERQPFLRGDVGVAVFATATQLGQQAPLLLGVEATYPAMPFDFVEAALASSAFPCVFSPRRESDLYPGVGAVEVRMADGGMFDNLPFMPAIGILSRCQEEYRRGSGRKAREFLQQRHAQPDLIIAGALDANPGPIDGELGDPFSVARRAKTLQNNVKIRSFVRLAERVHGQAGALLDATKTDPVTAETERIMDALVTAGVLPVFPTDRDHLNPTFAFSASMGLKRARVLRSVADGCFQTLAAFAQAPADAGPLAAALRGLSARVPRMTFAAGRRPRRGDCPYFTNGGRPLRCPFARDDTRAMNVYAACAADARHQALHRAARSG